MSEEIEEKIENLKSDLLLLISEATDESIADECQALIDDLAREAIESFYGESEDEDDMLDYREDMDTFRDEEDY